MIDDSNARVYFSKPKRHYCTFLNDVDASKVVQRDFEDVVAGFDALYGTFYENVRQWVL